MIVRACFRVLGDGDRVLSDRSDLFDLERREDGWHATAPIELMIVHTGKVEYLQVLGEDDRERYRIALVGAGDPKPAGRFVELHGTRLDGSDGGPAGRCLVMGMEVQINWPVPAEEARGELVPTYAVLGFDSRAVLSAWPTQALADTAAAGVSEATFVVKVDEDIAVGLRERFARNFSG